MKKAVILLSGGIDSAVCASVASKEGYELYGLTINYGQTNAREIECAKKIASDLKFKIHRIIDISGIKSIIPSALTSDEMKICMNRNLKQMSEEIPSTYVPARNLIFLSLTSAFCETVGAEAIFVGFNQMDYSGYPDCRNEFIKAMESTINLGIAKAVNNELHITIKAPLLYLNKRDIILLGNSLGTKFKNTWSCYVGGEDACGTCDACILRKQGFSEANILDPLNDMNKKKMTLRLFFVTGNRNKVDIFNKVMGSDYLVDWFRPLQDISELVSPFVQEVVFDKLEKAYEQFRVQASDVAEGIESLLFVTDVGVCIAQLDGRPGAMIKRETKRLFKGNFDGWCSYLDPSKPRDAYVQMSIAARNSNQHIIVDHRVEGYIARVPQHGDYGFDWDSIFIPDPTLVPAEYRNKSFAQIPEEIKFAILMEPAIKEFKKKLDALS